MLRLDGLAILVAEDEPLVSLDVAELLRSLGATVVLASSVRIALAHADSADIAAAMLDINLVGEDCLPVCQRLSERSIPFMFYSGYTDAPAFRQWPAALVVRKPADHKSIVEALTRLNYVLHRPDGQAAS